MTIAQAQRQLRIETPLGQDRLLLYQLSAQEALSQLFEYQAELLSEEDAIPLESLLGKKVDIELGLTQGGIRVFNAYVTSFSQVGVRGDLFHYQAILRPWPWFLTLTRDCRIFQNLTVPQILCEIFEENGFSDYELRLSGSYRTWEYCVQYRESDYNFVSRLMEEEGVYYFFSHAKGKHTLVLSDSHSSHDPLRDGPVLAFYPEQGSGGHRAQETVRRWMINKVVQTGSYAHTDYDFTKPRADLGASAPMPQDHPHGGYEVFDYPGSYECAEDGGTRARHRIEEMQGRHERLQGEGDIRHLTVGGLFNLSGHPRTDQNREYLVTEARVELQADPYLGGNLVNLGETCRCEFTAIPGRQAFRCLRTTEKPTVEGPQTAVVVGPVGEEIYCDKYGRVKVQFHWDRYGKSDENSSCWVRVAQLWAGKNWGGMHIPRVGQEVIVDFLEGDPDKPIITGRVYNAEQMPPWDLPANQTQSGILSRSTKQGAVTNANAIRFEDKKGEEQLWLHAEKDQLTEVEHDESKWVGNDRVKTIDGDESTAVHKNRTETVDLNERITIHQNRSERVDLNETISIGQNRSEDVGLNEIVTIGANKAETVALAKAETIGLAKALTIGAAYQVSVGAAMNTTVALGQGEEIGHAKQVSVGKNYSVSVGNNYTLEAKEKITLKVGKSSLVMNKDGSILLNGVNLDIAGALHIQLDSERIDLN
ncbi:MAG: type VI secretion system tip protein TssI/VgrG [Candidatus Thiodiazotropha sp.]